MPWRMIVILFEKQEQGQVSPTGRMCVVIGTRTPQMDSQSLSSSQQQSRATSEAHHSEDGPGAFPETPSATSILLKRGKRSRGESTNLGMLQIYRSFGKSPEHFNSRTRTGYSNCDLSLVKGYAQLPLRLILISDGERSQPALVADSRQPSIIRPCDSDTGDRSE